MDTQLILDYCAKNTALKWETAQALMQSKRYADCLFFCHLALEFALKGKVVAHTGAMFPITHDLEALMLAADITLIKATRVDLAVINTFNIAGRYDDYKLSFYKRATRAYAIRYMHKAEKLLLWLNALPQNKT